MSKIVRLVLAFVTVVALAAGCASENFGGPASVPTGSGQDTSVESSSTPAPSSSYAPSSGSASVDTQTLQRLWTIADDGAKANGGTVLNAEAVASTDAKAEQVTSGNTGGTDEPVWVIQVEGTQSFTCRVCRFPAGAHAPTGRYLLYIVGQQTFQQTEFGLGATDNHLDELGTVISLHS